MFSTPGFPPAALREEADRVRRVGQTSASDGRAVHTAGSAGGVTGGRPTVNACRREAAPLEGAPDGSPPVSDDRALAELYRTESPKLIRILARRTRDSDEARDLVQDVFYRFARLGEGRAGTLERPQAYLRRIVANLLKDRAKLASRRSVALHVVADEERLPGLDQHGLLESRDMLRRLEAAILRLRPRTREIFVAHRIEGLTYSEIAERTGLSVKGVEKQMSKALVQLDRLLNG
jgi:RNA polymerase sigma-70 factor (ECF subfamily)